MAPVRRRSTPAGLALFGRGRGHAGLDLGETGLVQRVGARTLDAVVFPGCGQPFPERHGRARTAAGARQEQQAGMGETLTGSERE